LPWRPPLPLADEQAALAPGFHGLKGLREGGLLCGAVLDHLHAEHEALPAHVPDKVVLLLELPQADEEVFPDCRRILLDTLLLDHAQYGAARSKRDSRRRC